MKMLLRDVPEQLHRKLKSQAALDGLTLNAYIIQALTWVVGYEQERKDKPNGGEQT